MRTNLFFIAIVLFFLQGVVYSQEYIQPYSAHAYWNELNNSQFRQIRQKQLNGDTLSKPETDWIKFYQDYLNSYKNNMTQQELENFSTSKDSLYAAAGIKELVPLKESKNTRDTDLLLKHVFYSGASGVAYGLLLNNIFDIQDDALRTGIPLLLAGGSILYPLFSKQYENINNNSLWLRSHGKVAGALQGYSASLLIFGENINGSQTYDEYGNLVEESVDRSQETSAIVLLSSFGLGQLGFYMGKNTDWTEGRASLYQYYGYLIPAVAVNTLVAANADNAHVYGGTILVSGAIGYFAADRVARVTNYTRGDVGAITGLTAIGTTYGLSVWSLFDYETDYSSLSLTLGALIGSAAGHYQHLDFHVSRQQGRRINFAAIGGGLIGIGFAAIINPDESFLYTALPATTGLIGYSIMHNYYKKHPAASYTQRRTNKIDYQFGIYPENLIFSRLTNSNYVPPLASFAMQF